MKTMKKLASLLLALAMIFALATTAFAQTIDITPPADSTGTNTYKIYKVFNATVSDSGISYTLVDGKTTAPAGFTVVNGYVTYAGTEGATQLTADDIAAIAAYVANDAPVKTVESTGTTHAVAENLDPGYYYITTSTGSVVTIDSTTEGTVEVKDKNTIPTLDKKITGADSVDNDGKKALAQIGTDVTYEVTITVGKGAEGYVFHDKMGTGLTFKGNDSVTVTGVDADKFTIKETPDEGDTLTITFDDGIAENTKITITYKATINESALSNDPEKNTAHLSYGDGHETRFKETEVYNAQFTVTKKDGEGKPLAGAGFVIKNAEDKYYKIAKDATNKDVVSWVANIDDATEHSSDDTGAVAPFIGLADGTYTLVEKTVPAGYNKAADSSFTIAEHDYTAANLVEQGATVTNNAGAELPSTGGMGTTLFYVVGGILVAAAAVLLVTKKRMAN